jgi:shikimate dehydrogenase
MSDIRLYGLIGKSLKHSFSPAYFKAKFLKENIPNSEYIPFELHQISEFSKLITEQKNLKGLNVTIPYKEEIIPFLSTLTPESQAIGAVNTIKIERNQSSIRLMGFNTDLIGFSRSVLPLLKPEHHSALILGTGGSAKMVAYFFKKAGIDYRFVSSSKNSDSEIIHIADLSFDVVRECKIIVNCTPVGMFPNIDAAPEIPYDAITPIHLLYDLIYNPAETKFLYEGKIRHATVKNGMEMLQIQAEASWKIWNQ